MVNAFTNNLNSKKQVMKNDNDIPTMQQIEVIPVLPTYCVSFIEICKVVKFLFQPGESRPQNVYMQNLYGLCEMEEYENVDNLFSTLPLHSDTAPADSVFDCYLSLEGDIDFTDNELKKWGITKVYFDAPTKVMEIQEYLQAYEEKVLPKFDTPQDAAMDFYYKSDEEKLILLGLK